MKKPLIKKTITSLFQKLGSKGTYKGKDILFLLKEPDEVVGIGFTNVHSSNAVLKIRKSDAPDLKTGDIIEEAERTYTIISEPRKDVHGLILTAEVKCT